MYLVYRARGARKEINIHPLACSLILSQQSQSMAIIAWQAMAMALVLAASLVQLLEHQQCLIYLYAMPQALPMPMTAVMAMLLHHFPCKT